ncbi:MAG: methyltransferase [Dehalococcoidales bacterium]|nr:methyltransferase [Dehalococcoidales bacterium]
MFYTILLGILGFTFIAGADWATYKRIPLLKPILWFLVIPVFSYALVLAWTDTARFDFPRILSILAWVPLLFFFGLFIYSLYIEIPLKRTYIDSPQPTKVITNGTYSLCRHPAALWFIAWLASAVLVSGSVTLAMAAPVWSVAYLVTLVWEEELCLKGEFGDDYKRYQAVTPMLIPNTTSISRFRKEVRSYFRTKSKQWTNH